MRTSFSGLYATYPKDRQKAVEAAREVLDFLPCDAVAVEEMDASKSEASFTEGTISDIERQRLLLASSVCVSDSSVELTALIDERLGNDGTLAGPVGGDDSQRMSLLKGPMRSDKP